MVPGDPVGDPIDLFSVTQDDEIERRLVALKETRDFGLDEAYDASRPLTGYGIYYMDCDAKGTLPDEVLNQDSKAHDGGLSK